MSNHKLLGIALFLKGKMVFVLNGSPGATENLNFSASP